MGPAFSGVIEEIRRGDNPDVGLQTDNLEALEGGLPTPTISPMYNTHEINTWKCPIQTVWLGYISISPMITSMMEVSHSNNNIV